MLTFAKVKRNTKEFLALTGLTVKEFKVLLPAFEQKYQQRYELGKTRAGTRRKRKAGGGAKSNIENIEDKLLFISGPAPRTGQDKLLFILVYQKTYPLQTVMGKLFEMGQSATNQWIHRLLPVERDALTELGFMPERNGQKFSDAERKRAEPKDYIIDGPAPRTGRSPRRATSAQNVGATGRKTLKNRHFITVARRSCIRIKISSLPILRQKELHILAQRAPELHTIRNKWPSEAARPVLGAGPLPIMKRSSIRASPSCTRTPGFKAMSQRSNKPTNQKKAAWPGADQR